MGRQARIKRERKRTRAEAPAVGRSNEAEPDSTPAEPRRAEPARVHVLTVPLPGFEGEADEHGHFDDCPACQALRDGDEARALQLLETQGTRIDVSKLHELDLAPFIAWCAAEGIDLDPMH